MGSVTTRAWMSSPVGGDALVAAFRESFAYAAFVRACLFG